MATSLAYPRPVEGKPEFFGPCTYCRRADLVTAVHRLSEYREFGVDCPNYLSTAARIHSVMDGNTWERCPLCAQSGVPTVACEGCSRPMPLGEALVSIRAGRGLRCKPVYPGGPDCAGRVKAEGQR